MRFCSATVLLLSLVLGLPGMAEADLVGHWTFEPGLETEDLAGNWGPLSLDGGAVIGEGQLDVDMSPVTWAMADGYTGPDIVSKTLVSWISLDDLSNLQPAGSAITIDRVSADSFDGIIFGEREAGRWMNGSSNSLRTQPFSPGFEETATDELIQLAYTYEDMGDNNVQITGYRNGEQIGQYTRNALAAWTADDAEVLFGIRHLAGGAARGSLDAHIEEARVYNEALTQAEIQALNFVSGTGTLTWDGTLVGNWASSNWVGANPPPPPNFPVDNEVDSVRAVIDAPGATITVAENGSAMSLNLVAGQLTIGAGNTLALGYSLKAPDATVALEDNAQLVAGTGGFVGTMTVAGTATVDVGHTMTVGTLTNVGPAAAFVKKGAGDLLLENADGTAIDFGGSTIQIDAGMLATNMAGIGDSSVVLGGGGLSLAAASPSVIPPMPMDNLILHLDPSELTVGDGNPVAAWADATGNGNDVSQAAVDQQPTLVNGVVNDLPVVRFDGGDFLSLPGGVLAENDDDYTYVAVWNPTRNTGVMTVMEQAGGGGGRRAAMLAVNGSYGFNGQGNDRHNLVLFSPGWTTSIMSIDNSLADNVQIFHNGQQFIGGTADPSALDVGVDAFYVGAKVTNNAELLDGDLAELLVYDAALASGDARALGLHLAAKYGFDTTAWSTTGVDATGLDWTVTDDSSLFINSAAPAVVSSPLMTHGVLTVDGLAGAEVTFVGGMTIDPAATMVGFDPRIPTDFGEINAAGASVQIVKGGSGTWTLESDPVVDGANSTWGVSGGTLKLDGIGPLSGRDIAIEGGTLETNMTGLGGAPVVLDGGTLSLAAESPSVIPPMPTDNLVLHLDPSELTVGDGNPVPAWADISAAGNDVAQAESDRQPTLVDGVLNDLPVVRFDGNDFLAGGAVLAEGDDDYTYVAVWNPTRNTGVMTVMEQAGGGGGRRAAMLAVNGSYGFNGQGNDRHNLVPFSPGWTTSIMTIDNSLADNVQIFHNGTEFVGATGNPGALDVGVDAFYVGAKVANNGELLDGDVAELLIYDAPLASSDARALGLYIADKYGFEVGPWSSAGVDATGLDWTVAGDSTLFINSAEPAVVSSPLMTQGILSVDGLAGAEVTFEGGVTIDPAATMVGFDPRIPTDFGEINAGGGSVQIVKGGPSTWTLESDPIVDGANSTWGVQGGTLKLAGDGVLGSRDVTIEAGGTLNTTVEGLEGSSVVLSGGTFRLAGELATELPPLPAEGLVLHLDPGQLALASGSLVATWNDVSGAGNDMSQAAEDAQPMFVDNVLNGLPVVRFDGDFLAGDPVLAEGDDDYTFIAVWNPTRNATMAILEQAGPGNGRRAAILTTGLDYGFNGQSNDAHDMVLYSPGEWVTTIMTMDNALPQNVHILHNDEEYVGGVANPGALDVGVQAFYVGAKVINDGERLFADVAELIVYENALTAEERAQVALYLGTKVGEIGAPVDGAGVDWSVIGDSTLFLSGGEGSSISAPRLIDGVLTVDSTKHGAMTMEGVTIDVGSTSAGFRALAPVTIGPITHEDGAGKQPLTIVTQGTNPITLAGPNSGLDDDLFNVQSGELRMVGLDSWGGSTQALLSGGLLAFDGGGAADVDMTTHTITVDGAASLEAANLTSLTLGQLTLADGGALTTTGSPIRINSGGAADTVIAAGATQIGLNTQSDTDLGVIDGGGAGATIQKLGDGTLVLDQPNVNLAGSTFDVQAGSLNAVATGSNPLDGASVSLGGGELLLSGSATGDSPTFDNAVDVTADSILGAGAGAGAVGPVDVTLGGPVTLTGGANLTLQTADDYTLSISGGVGGAGSVSISEGDVTLGGAEVSQLLINGGQLSLPDGGSAGDIVVSDGLLSLGGDLNVATARVTGGSVDLDGHGIVVSDTLRIVDVNYEISDGSTFKLTGADMAVDPTLTLAGGTLNVSVPTLPTENLTLHLAANDIAGLQDGDSVDQWNDLSGMDNHLFQDDGGAQPTYVEDVINGLPVIRFDGSQFLVRDGTVLEEGDDDYTFVAVWYPTTTDAVMAVMEQAGAGAHRRASMLAVNAAYGFNGQNNDRHDLVPYNPEEWVTTLMTMDNAADPNNVHILHNGEVFEGRSGDPGALDVGIDGFMVGAKVTTSGGNEWMQGDIAELLVYDIAMLPGDQVYDELLEYLTEKYTGAGVTPGVIDQSTTNVNVLADSTLVLNSVGDALLGDLTIEPGVQLEVDGAAVDVRNIIAGDGSTMMGDLLVRSTFSLGDAGIAAFTIEGTLEMYEEGTFLVEFGADPSGNDFVEVIGDAYLSGSLQLKALEAIPPDGKLYGDSSRSMTVMQTDEEGVVELDDFAMPGVGTHLGHGVFLTGLAVELTEWETTLNVNTDLLQAAPGDADADGDIDIGDLQSILAANSFNNGTGFGWSAGDFNGDTEVNISDLQLILMTGLFGTGSYAATGAGIGGVPANGLSVVPEPGTLLMLAGGLTGLLLWTRRRRRA